MKSCLGNNYEGHIDEILGKDRCLLDTKHLTGFTQASHRIHTQETLNKQIMREKIVGNIQVNKTGARRQGK